MTGAVRAPVVAFLLAAAVNTVVAWALALYVEGDRGAWITPAEFYAERLPGMIDGYRHETRWPVPVPAGWDEPETASRRVGFGYREVKHQRWGGGPGQQVHYVYEAGWPLRSHRATLFHEKPSDLSAGWMVREYAGRPWVLARAGLPAWRLPGWMRPAWDDWDNPFEWRRAPVVPIPIGFVVNTLFYGVLWWCLFLGLGRWRSRRRAKRGLCPRCGYDRGGLGAGGACPECGASAAR